ncbi:unnamed protein product [Rotaria magnacalcarata]|uniref:Conserved oligomeric Golgi complex subunit 8 n=2 Tax=Rotaria magnacalcarata TaxID=392030 RepID=A0A819WAZ5_9BILA|nr:unnamed protein product [Rotaria magnacalcarata]CAF1644549.1 unnamed protein product [Rotaria magnacalcarata]CAF2003794.1 unnamed protein product [Rotaria magnacalcarata]CAF2091253.1 unnamed protein product [Rotaria magnacalcarata]CAF2213119.1 unnamed protein product [Rotaria magnacalcarata]
MELDEQTLLQSLIKNSSDESVNSAECTSYLPYLQTLFTYDTERLHRELEYLNDEKCSKSTQMLSLIFDNYSTFIQTAECSKNISNDFSTIEERLSVILKQLDDFSSCCQKFVRETEQTNHLRKQNMFTLQKYPQLLEILEIPQLMDTCVRNDYFDEALEIVTYCKRLERKFAPPTTKLTLNTNSQIPIIVHIVNDVRLSLEYMLEQLVNQLQTNIQLPACLRIMGFIRRMDIYNELELRLCFLQARTHFLHKRLGLIQQQYSSTNIVDYYEHASKYIDETRNILFDIVTQYRALFSDDDTTLYVTFNRNEFIKETNLFRSWLIHRLSEFLKVLQVDLQHCSGSQYQRLESLLGQVMYFGASFSRYGFDFRPLFIQFFSQTTLTNFRNSLHEANHIFEQLLNSFTFDQYVQLATSDSSATPLNPFSPPMILVNYTPLAVYCNVLLTAFNDLRLCCPLSIVIIVRQLVTDSLVHIRNILTNYYKSEKVTLTIIESEHFIDFLRVFIRIFIPYINTCIQALFPDTQLARELGVSILDITEKSKLNQIDIDQIIEPIKAIIDSVMSKKKTKSIENVQSEIETIPSKVNDQQEQESTTVNTDNKSGVIE